MKNSTTAVAAARTGNKQGANKQVHLFKRTQRLKKHDNQRSSREQEKQQARRNQTGDAAAPTKQTGDAAATTNKHGHCGEQCDVWQLHASADVAGHVTKN